VLKDNFNVENELLAMRGLEECMGSSVTCGVPTERKYVSGRMWRGAFVDGGGPAATARV